MVVGFGIFHADDNSNQFRLAANGKSGVFSGFFSEPGNTSDPNIPGGVGLTYSIQDAQGTTTVSGAAAFGNP